MPRKTSAGQKKGVHFGFSLQISERRWLLQKSEEKTQKTFEKRGHFLTPSENPVFSMLCASFGSENRIPAIPQTRMKPHFLISEGVIFWPVVSTEMDVLCLHNAP